MAKRLKSWDDLYGHKNQIRYIRKQIEEDRVPDVIIFHGNSGIGKSSIAKLLAVDVTSRFESEELRQSYIKSVIEENKSTDSIKLFNMSEIQEKEEEIQRVKAEFTLAFSKTKRKVLILDEAHNMSRAAQDSVLTELEHLPEGVYVFICTTEIGSLRAALKSRSKAEFALSDLSDVEAKQFTRKCIADMHLTFDMTQEMVVTIITEWAQNQPRKIANLLENFPDGSLVKTKDLEVFINISTVSSVIELLKYLYGSMTLGIDYLNSMKFDDSFVFTLLEVCKVALGYQSSSVSVKDTMYIREFMQGRDETNLIQFTAEVAGLSELRKRRVISAFMKNNTSYRKGLRPVDVDTSKSNDMRELINNVETVTAVIGNSNPYRGVTMAPTLEEMFEDSEVVE